MERLTKRWGAQPYPNLAGKVICEYKECDSTRSCEECIHGRYKDRLAAIEDILGDEYDLGRLRELAQADRDGRCVVLPEGGCEDKDGENALKSAMHTCFYHNNPVTRFIADAVAEKLTRQDAQAALRREQDGQGGRA